MRILAAVGMVLALSIGPAFAAPALSLHERTIARPVSHSTAPAAPISDLFGVPVLMAMAPPVGQKISRRAWNSIVNRFQGPELLSTFVFAVNTSPIMNRNITLNRPLESLKIIWRGRVVIGTADYTAVAAEAPQSIIQRIRITGTHKTLNQLVPIDISGASLFVWNRLFQQTGCSLIINGTRITEPSTPLAMLGATFGNQATYDIEIHYDIPVGPMLAQAMRGALVPYYWMPSDWADTLQLQLFFGDKTSWGTPAGGTTVTLTAFGSGSGSPTVDVMANYCLLGPLQDAIAAAVCIRNETPFTGSLAAVANNIRLALLAKQKTTNLVVKTGINLTGVTAGVQVFSSLKDDMLDRTQVVVDNKAIKNNPANYAAKDYAAKMFNAGRVLGYLVLPFIESGSPLTALQGQQIGGGSTFEIDSDVKTNTANQLGLIVQEQIYGTPGAR